MNTAIHARRMRRVLWTCAGSILDSLRVFRRGASLLLVAAPAAMAGYLALATLSGILPVLQVWLVKLVVDALTGPAGHPKHATGHVLVLAVLYALTFVGLTVLDPLEGMVIPVLQSRAAAEIDRRLMQAGTRNVDLALGGSPPFHHELRPGQGSALHPFLSLPRVREG